MWMHLGLINNLVGVMIIHAARFATFSTFLLRSYMVTIPRDFPHHRTDHQARIPDRGDMGFSLVAWAWAARSEPDQPQRQRRGA